MFLFIFIVYVVMWLLMLVVNGVKVLSYGIEEYFVLFVYIIFRFFNSLFMFNNVVNLFIYFKFDCEF